jgi:hypothetical protein
MPPATTARWPSCVRLWRGRLARAGQVGTCYIGALRAHGVWEVRTGRAVPRLCPHVARARRCEGRGGAAASPPILKGAAGAVHTILEGAAGAVLCFLHTQAPAGNGGVQGIRTG